MIVFILNSLFNDNLIFSQAWLFCINSSYPLLANVYNKILFTNTQAIKSFASPPLNFIYYVSAIVFCFCYAYFTFVKYFSKIFWRFKNCICSLYIENLNVMWYLNQYLFYHWGGWFNIIYWFHVKLFLL